MTIFVELIVNELSGCIAVVGLKSRKWGHFRGASCAAPCATRLVGLALKTSASLRLFFCAVLAKEGNDGDVVVFSCPPQRNLILFSFDVEIEAGDNCHQSQSIC